LSAGLFTALLIVVSVLFIATGLTFLLNEFTRAYIFVSSFDFTKLFPEAELAAAFKNFTKIILSKFVESASTTVSRIPSIMLSMFIFFLSYFFFLKDGKKLWTWVKKDLYLPMDHKDVWTDVQRYIHAFVYVWVIIAVLQFIVASIGFYLFGFPYPLLMGLIAAILSLIPIIGPYLLYAPVGILTVMQGDVGIGIGILLYGLTIGSFLDYVVRPYYAGKWAKVHPLVLLVGIFGGMALLGPAGIIIGPILFLGITAVLKDIGGMKSEIKS
jgi:predicted PurR-regulated permease PerM